MTEVIRMKYQLNRNDIDNRISLDDFLFKECGFTRLMCKVNQLVNFI